MPIDGDANNDGFIDVGDLGIFAAHYGEGISGVVDFNADYAKVFGSDVAEKDSSNEVLGDSLCGLLGLPLIADFLLAGSMLGAYKIYC